MYQCNHFLAFSFQRGLTGSLPASSWALPGSTCALPGSTWALPASSGNDWGSDGMNHSFTWSLPGWSRAHPGWLVGNYRTAAEVSVTAT
jgi:hypothetical protein